MELAVFAFLALLSLAFAVSTIAWKNPLRCAFSLILCLFSLAGVYVMLYAHFLAAMQVLVYAGAIMVLFVFVIMLLNLTPGQLGTRKVTLLSVLGGIVVLMVAGKFAKVIWFAPPIGGAQAVPAGVDFGGVGRIGELLFKQFLLPFELASVLLLVAVVGAVVLARRRFWGEEK